MRLITSTLVKVIRLALLVAGCSAHSALAADGAAHQSATVTVTTEPGYTGAHGLKRANFERESASEDARKMADWVVDSSDNLSMPFAIVDKKDAKVYVFHADGRLRAKAPALLGLAVGDDSVPGIGDRKLSSIRPDERTTPAGRFVVAMDRNLHGKEILWVDYDTAISLHAVVTSNVKERRGERLATPSALDNRVSYGCINVPGEFFHSVVSPAFTGTDGIVYVLPETRSAQKVFASYDVDERVQLQAASQLLPTQAPSQNDTRYAER